MTTLLELVLAIGIVGALIFFRTQRPVWTMVVAGLLFIYSIASTLSWWVLLPAWAVFLAVAALFNVDEWRYSYLSEPLLKFFKKSLPPMSETERVAMDAGDVWWDGELFAGRPDWQALHRLTKPMLTKDEQHFISNEVEQLCEMLDDWDIIQRADLSENAWQFIKEKGFWGLEIPKEYGGKGFSALAHSTIVTKIASRSTSAAVTVMVPNSLGPAELIHLYGTQEQKKHYLPRLAKGQEIPCFALTGPNAGSDAGAIGDTGVVCKGKHEGKEVLGIRLNWDKRYITLAPVATVLGLAFKLYDPEHLLGDKEDIGISLCLIPTSHPGVEIGERHLPMGMAFMNGPTYGKDVFIPLDWIIGGPDMVGEGWRMLMEALSIGRGISLPALSTATGHKTYRTTGAYARVRKQFKVPIGQFEGVQEPLARIAGYTYMLEASRVLTAHAVDQDIKPAVVSAIAKYHMTELNRLIMDDAMDIHAGRAIQLGPRNYLGSHYSAIPISITVEGANILTRNLMIFGQGAVRCHPYIRDEMSCSQKDNAIAEFDDLIQAHIGYSLSNFVRSFCYGLSAGRLIRKPVTGELGKYYQQLTRMSCGLATVSDVAMLLLGGDLKRKEALSARLGDVLSQLYLASSVLKYHHDQGKPAEDLPYVHWCLQTCLAKCQIAFDEFFANFPYPILAKFLRFTIFPFGRSYRMPSDKLGAKLAKDMQQPSELRDRLTQYCFVGKHADDPIGRMDNCMQKVIAAERAEKKLQDAIKTGLIDTGLGMDARLDEALNLKVLTKFETQAIREAEKAVADAIAVDNFPFDLSAEGMTTKRDEKSA